MVGFIKKFATVWKYTDKLGNTPHYSSITRRPPKLAFFLREDTFNLIRRFCDVETDQEIANALDFGKSYISKMQKNPLTEEVMCRIIALLGMEDRSSWSSLFKLVKMGDYDGSHQKYNNLKYEGIMPYRDPISASFRAQGSIIDLRKDDEVITIGHKCRGGRRKVEKAVS